MAIENKRPKDPKLYSTINRTIHKDCKLNSHSKDEFTQAKADFAEEIGTKKGHLEQKLKPSVTTNDLNLSEYIHILEVTGDYSSLEYLCGMFDMSVTRKLDGISSVKELDTLTDTVMLESADVFRVSKEALADGKWTESEKERALKEIAEQEQALADFKAAVESAVTAPGEE